VIITCGDENATQCGDECVDLRHNRRHCGACGNACAAGSRCCDGECINVRSNDDHCGACGNACPNDTPTCCAGTCIREVYSEDMNNCGGCGWRCPEGATWCGAAVCCFPDPDKECVEPLRPCNECTEQERCCDDSCRVIVDDRTNCGACDHACGADEICIDRACVSCPLGRVVCGTRAACPEASTLDALIACRHNDPSAWPSAAITGIALRSGHSGSGSPAIG
jgi:hypothetical protein